MPPRHGKKGENDVHHMEGINQMQLGSLPLAQAYIPMQTWGEVYTPEEGTQKGTIFPDLYRPYERKGHDG